MTQTTPCEHCGSVTPVDQAESVIADGWTHYFCSERCKIQWGELAEIEEEE